MTFLVIEDSLEIQEAIKLIFDIHWHDSIILYSNTGAEGIQRAKDDSPDLIILDLGLPDMDGLKVLKEIREFSNMPVIILTVRSEETDIIRGLELGADDFIVKPFTHRELLKRIMVVLQRTNGTKPAPSTKQVASHPDINRTYIDFKTRTLVKNGKHIKLTATETSLLEYLYLHKDSRVPSTELLKKLWGDEYKDCTEYLSVFINSLRQKIDDNPESQQHIVSVDNNNYSLVNID